MANTVNYSRDWQWWDNTEVANFTLFKRWDSDTSDYVSVTVEDVVIKRLDSGSKRNEERAVLVGRVESTQFWIAAGPVTDSGVPGGIGQAPQDGDEFVTDGGESWILSGPVVESRVGSSLVFYKIIAVRKEND